MTKILNQIKMSYCQNQALRCKTNPKDKINKNEEFFCNLRPFFYQRT